MRKRRISTTQLAEICGVSQGTVDRALNNRKGINPETRDRILAVASEYGYCADMEGNMAAPGTVLIGVIVYDLNDPVLVDILSKIESFVDKENGSVVVMFTNQDVEREIDCIKNLYSMSVDGLIICPSNQGMQFENYLRSLKLPVVTILKELSDIPFVDGNDVHQIHQVLEDILHKRIKNSEKYR